MPNQGRHCTLWSTWQLLITSTILHPNKSTPSKAWFQIQGNSPFTPLVMQLICSYLCRGPSLEYSFWDGHQVPAFTQQDHCHYTESHLICTWAAKLVGGTQSAHVYHWPDAQYNALEIVVVTVGISMWFQVDFGGDFALVFDHLWLKSSRNGVLMSRTGRNQL